MEMEETSGGGEGLEGRNETGNMEDLQDFEVFTSRNLVNVVAFLVMSIGIQSQSFGRGCILFRVFFSSYSV